MSALPEIREIIRWEYKPGDRLFVRIAGRLLSREQANDIARMVRARAQLPEDAPIVVADESITFEVISGPD